MKILKVLVTTVLLSGVGTAAFANICPLPQEKEIFRQVTSLPVPGSLKWSITCSYYLNSNSTHVVYREVSQKYPSFLNGPWEPWTGHGLARGCGRQTGGTRETCVFF